jgi:para-aminobenzoate synthetase component 1
MTTTSPKTTSPETTSPETTSPVSAALQERGLLSSANTQRGVRRFRCDLDPLAALCRLADRRRPFLLDSADSSHPDGRFSILGCDPWALLRAKGGRGCLELFASSSTPEASSSAPEGGPVWLELGAPLPALAALQAALHAAPPPPAPIPFAGGAVGYLGYDLGRDIERIPSRTVDDLGTDDLCLAFFDWALVFDHAEQRWWLAATARRPAAEPLEALLDRQQAWLAQKLGPAAPCDEGGEGDEGGVVSPGQDPGAGDPPAVPARRGFSHPAYVAAVERAIEHIRAGDIYQVNLSQRFDVPLPPGTNPLALYRRLRARTRALFSAYLDTPSAQVLSLSPERFLRVRGREVETCPIKGTRPRGADPAEDAALATELTASTKDRAELSMIVDLERNDLGRICAPGSVQVAEHAALYTLATVHHTVTRVTGRLRPEVDTATLLRATFPGGSITGAPKIRAMEIIEDLEPTRRGVYTGAVGYLDYAGDLDLNIAIRTVPVVGDTAYVQAGGGIVADSDPEAEHEETLTKARALLAGLGAYLP